MATYRERDQARSAASMAATRLHSQLKTPFDTQVDVLGIARSLGLVLMMQPLDNLLGFYVRSSEASGIVVSSRVPESLQRFTLAHEIGHHVLGHEGTLDDSNAVDRFDSDNLFELQAQSFAAALLMPLPLVNRAMRDLPSTKQGRPVRHTDAYLFSRQLGVSYTAGVWALFRADTISREDARRFIRSGALAAKAGLTGGDLAQARADVWMLTEENNDLSVLCRVGDEIHVQLPEDTSTGYTWAIRSPAVADFYDPSWAHNAVAWDGADGLTVADVPGPPDQLDEAVDVIQDEHQRPGADVDAPGTHNEQVAFPEGGGVREMTFVPTREGEAGVSLELRRAWEADSASLRQYDLELVVRSRQLGGAGLLAPERDDWVDDNLAIA